MPKMDKVQRAIYQKLYRARPEVRMRDNANAKLRYHSGGKEKKKAYDAIYSKTKEYKTRRVQYMLQRRIDNWSRVRIRELVYRAKKLGVPFDLTADDIKLPKECPILGIPLIVCASGHLGPKMNSPSVDRIIPSKGYVKGNVIVVSMRANVLKKDATVSELKKLAAFYAALQPEE